MGKKDKLFYKKLKEIQSKYIPDEWDKRSPYDWKKEWGPILNQDCDWDYTSFFNLILYKLEKIYLSLDIYSVEARESLDKNLAELKKIIKLGKKIKDFDYIEEARNWSEEHCASCILIYNKTIREENLLHKIVRSKDSEDDKRDNVDDYMEYFFGTKEAKAWAKDHGYNPDDIELAYSGEWDCWQNEMTHTLMLERAIRKEQKDINKFFRLIAENYRKWWW